MIIFQSQMSMAGMTANVQYVLRIYVHIILIALFNISSIGLKIIISGLFVNNRNFRIIKITA